MRLSKEAMNRINSAVLQQFSQKGLTINEGIAVDARLVQSTAIPFFRTVGVAVAPTSGNAFY